MINGIEGLPFGSEMGVHTATKSKEAPRASFSGYLANAINSAEETQNQFSFDTQQLLTGEADNLADVTINANKAHTALTLVLTVRDKAVDAYKEVMNMSL